MRPEVTGFFDEATNTISYIVRDPDSRRAAIIDPVLDFDVHAARTSTQSLDRVCQAIDDAGLEVDWILETHPHADHLSGAAILKQRCGGRIAIGEGIVEVQRVWRDVFDLGSDFRPDGHQFDQLFADGDGFSLGNLKAKVMHTPGHTPACVTYVIGDAAFVGDTLFMPDFGSARTDFPGGDARALYRSIRRILALPEDTRVFVAHDYGPGGRRIAWETTVAAERAENKHVRDGIEEEEFVALRQARDKELSAPALLLPSIQVNIRAGALPPKSASGTVFLKIPVNSV